MPSASDLKDSIDTSTPALLLCSLFSAGIFMLVYLAKCQPVIEEKTQVKTANKSFVELLTVALGLSLLFSGAGIEQVEKCASMLLLACGLLIAWWSLLARKALIEYALKEHQIELRLNIVWTILFNIFYINFCINDLPEQKKKQFNQLA